MGISRRRDFVSGNCYTGLQDGVRYTDTKAETAGRDDENLRAQFGKDVVRMIARARDGLECDLAAARDGAGALVEAGRREVEAYTRAVVGMGPQATLRRGFAIARGSDDRPITSCEAATQAAEFIVEFHDGAVPVAVRRSEGG
jgi:exodeoxyribonuclease VII large subunit